MAFVNMHIFSLTFYILIWVFYYWLLPCGGYLISIAYCLFFHLSQTRSETRKLVFSWRGSIIRSTRLRLRLIWTIACHIDHFVVGIPSFLQMSKFHMGSIDSSVGRASDSWSQGRGFDPHSRHGVLSLSKTLHPHCLVLIKPRKPSQNDRKIVDRDVKPQTNKPTNKFHIIMALFILHKYLTSW